MKREKDRRWKCSIAGECWRFTITIKRDVGGRLDSGSATRKTYERCQIGDRWPDCKKGKR